MSRSRNDLRTKRRRAKRQRAWEAAEVFRAAVWSVFCFRLTHAIREEESRILAAAVSGHRIPPTSPRPPGACSGRPEPPE